MNTAAKVVFASVFLMCTVVFVGFVLIAWLGPALGLMWMIALTPFALVLVWHINRYMDDGPPGSRDGRGLA